MRDALNEIDLSEMINRVSRRSLDGSVVMSSEEWNGIVELVEKLLTSAPTVPAVQGEPSYKEMYKEFSEWCQNNRGLDLDCRLHTHGGPIDHGGYISDEKTRVAFAAYRAGRLLAPHPADQQPAPVEVPSFIELTKLAIEYGIMVGPILQGSRYAHLSESERFDAFILALLARYDRPVEQQPAPSVQREPVEDGWRLIAVNEVWDALERALSRACNKGYMPVAMDAEWDAFDWTEAPQPAKQQPAPDVDGLVEALEEISDPIRFMKERLEDGERLNGMAAVQLAEDASYLRGIARASLDAYRKGAES